MIKALLGAFLFWIRIDNRYRRIANDPEKKQKSNSLGVIAIILSLVCDALVVLSLFALIHLIHWFMNMDGGLTMIIMLVFVFALCLVLLVAAIYSFIYGVICPPIYAILQLRLNKKPIGWIALVVWILSIVAMGAGIFLVLSNISI